MVRRLSRRNSRLKRFLIRGYKSLKRRRNNRSLRRRNRVMRGGLNVGNNVK